MTRREWTYPQLRDVALRFRSGETWRSIGESYGVSPHTVRTVVRRAGIDTSRKPNARRVKDEALILAAITRRNVTRESWSMVAEAVGYTGQPESLRQACRRYAARRGHRVATGMPAVRRTRWDTDTHAG